MTVPTNNEDREAAALSAFPESDKNVYPAAIVALARDAFRKGWDARRLPVSGDNGLSDETLRQTYLDAAVIEHQRLKVGAHNLDSRMREIDRAGLRAVANLAAAQPREVEVTKAKRVPIADPASYCSKCSRYGWHAEDCAAALGGGE